MGSGGARAGAGRKPLLPGQQKPRKASIHISVTEAEAELIKAKAAAAGKTVSAYLLELVENDK